MDPHSPEMPSCSPFSDDKVPEKEDGSKLISLDAPDFADIETELVQIRQQIVGGLNRLRQTALRCSQHPPGSSDQAASPFGPGGQSPPEAPVPEECVSATSAQTDFKRRGEPLDETREESADAAMDTPDGELGDGFWTAGPSTAPVVDVDPVDPNELRTFPGPAHGSREE